MYRLVKDTLELIGLTTEDLADKAGIAATKVLDFENNKPSLTAEEVRKIAEAWLELVREKSWEADAPNQER